MALCPSTVASSGKPMDLYFALQEDIPAPQVLSQNGNTISLSGGGGSVNVASATAVALSTQKLTATTYDLGFNATNFSGLVRAEGEIFSAPNLGQGSASLNGGLAEVTVGAVPPASLPKVRFQKVGFPDATMEYTGAAFTFNPPLADSDFQTLSLIGNDLTISGGNTVDMSAMTAITTLETQTQNITATPGVTDVSGILHATQDIQTDSIFIAKGLPQPRVEFHDAGGIAQGQVGWNEITGRSILYGSDGFKINSAADIYKIEGHPAVGYLGIETKGTDIEMRRYDATATTMETRVKVESGGIVSITGAVAGGGIKAQNVITPAGNIGAPGEYLVKSGTNEIAWAASAPGTWAGTALSDLDMNGFKITDATQLNLTAPSLILDGIPSAIATNLLNYDPATKLVSYAPAPPYTFLRSAPLPFVPPATIPSGTATAVSYTESGTVLGSDLTLNGSGGFVCNTNGQYAINVEICGTFASPAHLDAPPYIELFDTTTSTVLRRQFLTYYEAPPTVPHAKKLQFLVNSASGLIAGNTYVFRIFQQNVGGLAMSIDYTPFSFTPTISGYFITRLS